LVIRAIDLVAGAIERIAGAIALMSRAIERMSENWGFNHKQRFSLTKKSYKNE